jgi:glycerophosphoryl diester phosphodiesterase
VNPLVIAHRGACWDEPENTLPAFERAIEVGADYVEFDVRAAPDGRLVCAHDRVRAQPPPHVPTLDDALAALAGRIGLAVELKEEDVTKLVLAALGQHSVGPDQLLILSSHVKALDLAQRLRPDVRMVLHLSTRRPDPTAATRFWGVGFEDRTARPRDIALAQSLGLATTVYTVNERRRMLELAALGVTGIFTDRPDLLRRTLESRQA